MTVKIILEAGVNHNGSLKRAKKMIDLASKAGADFVKFQSFLSDDLVTTKAKNFPYLKNKKIKDTQYKMLKKLELSDTDHFTLIKYCKRKNINFLSSPFSIERFNLLNKLGLKIIKIPSGEINNFPYLRHIGRFKKKIILSTGMSVLQEIKDALKILISAGTPKKNITVLHCNTDYPTPLKDVNLNAMITLKKELGVNVGYSDHTVDENVPVVATTLGATIIEKHFTLNKKKKGADHHISLEPKDFKIMVKKIRLTEKMMGNKEYEISKEVKKKRNNYLRYITTKKEIKKGEIFSFKNIGFFRHNKRKLGLEPKFFFTFKNKKSKMRIKKNVILSKKNI